MTEDTRETFSILTKHILASCNKTKPNGIGISDIPGILPASMAEQKDSPLFRECWGLAPGREQDQDTLNLMDWTEFPIGSDHLPLQAAVTDNHFHHHQSSWIIIRLPQ